MYSNHEDKCFVCSQTGGSLNIFNTYNICDTKEESYVEVIKNCFNIEITVDSGLNIMCSDCSFLLKRAYCFRNDVVKAINRQIELQATNENEKEYLQMEYTELKNQFEGEFNISTVLNPETGLISYTVDKINEKQDSDENVPQSYLIDLKNEGIIAKDEANKNKVRKHKRKINGDVVKENNPGNVEKEKPKKVKNNKKKKVPKLDENVPKVDAIKDSVKKPRKGRGNKIFTIEGTVDDVAEDISKKKPKKPSKANQPPPFTLDPGQRVCKVCSNEYDTTKALSTHMNVHYPNYVCSECGMAFASQRRLRMHRFTHVEGPLACKYCEKQFTNPNSCNAHMWRVHKTTNPYKCSQCDERFKTYLKRLRHVQTVHGNAVEYQCQYCDKKFAYAAYRTKHIRTMHLDVRPHKCPSCPYSFARRRELDAHRASKHGDGEMKYQCDVCTKKFYFKTALISHMKLHKDKFACNQCDAKFSKLPQLEAHHKSHEVTQDVPFIENILPILEPLQLDEFSDYTFIDTSYWALSGM